MPLVLLLAAGLYLYYQQGKSFIESYKIKFIDALFDFDKTKNSAFTRIYFSIQIEVYNITDFTGTLQSARLNLSYNGKAIGYASVSNAVTITKNGITKVSIPVSVPTTTIITSIAQMVQAIQDQKALIFNVQGTLNFAIGTVTVNENYKVALTYS